MKKGKEIYGREELCEKIDKSIKRSVSVILSAWVVLFPILMVAFIIAQAYADVFPHGFHIALIGIWIISLLLTYFLLRKLKWGSQNVAKIIRDLKEKVALSRTLFEETPIAIVLFNSKNEIISVNSFFTSITGYKYEDIADKKIDELFDDNHEILRKTSEFYSYKGKEVFLTTKNNERKRVLVKISTPADENKSVNQLVFLDVSEEYRYKQQIEEIYKVIRISGRIARSGGFKYIVSKNIIIIPHDVAALLGIPRKTSYKLDDLLEAISEKDRKSVLVRFDSLAESDNKDSFVVDYELKMKTDGKRIFVRQICELEITDEGEKIIWGALYDISEIERQRELLREKERKYYSMSNVAPVGITLLDVEEAYMQLKKHFRGKPTREALQNLTTNEIKGILSRIKMIEFNDNISAFFDNQRSLVNAENFIEMIDPNDLPKILNVFYTIFTSDNFDEVSLKFKNPINNRPYYTLFRVKRFYTENKMHAVFTTSDFTEYMNIKTELETTNELLYNFLNTIPFIVVSLDTEGNVIFINKTGAKLIGENKEEIVGKNWFDSYLPKEDKNRLYPLFRKIMSEKRASFPNKTNRVNTKNGIKQIYWYNEIIFDEEKDPKGTLSLGVDITGERRKRDELNKSYKELVSLKHRLEKQNKELNQIKKVLEEREKLLEKEVAEKDKLFSIIAHDIRSPFTGLLSNLQLLTEVFEELSEEEKIRLATGAYKSSLKIYNFIDMLLRWSQVKLNKFRSSPTAIQVQTLVNEILLLFNSQIDKKELTVKNEIDETVCLFADEYLFSSVIRNLVANAIKFTPHKGMITIKAEEHERIYEIKISDTGVGIPREKLDALFNFDSIRSTPGTEGEKGTGMGLMLVKEFINKLGGRIYVDSKVNEGTTFIIYIPKSNECRKEAG